MDEKEQQIVKSQERHDILEIAPDEVKRKLDNIHKFQAIVKNSLHKDHDFGVIPGTTKPTLLKPGAEKIAKLMNLQDDYDILRSIEDWEKPFFHYEVKCRLTEISSGILISAGLGSCNSMESKYRWRWIPEWKLTEDQKQVKEQVVSEEKPYKSKQGKFKLYRFENDDIFSQVNTLLKMAKKRALVDASLSAGRLSDLFTQDLEDLSEHESAENLTPSESKVESEPKKENSGQEKICVIIAGKKYWGTRNWHKKEFEKVEKKLSSEIYKAVLGREGYTNFDEIPDDEIGKVYEAILNETPKK